MTATDDVSNALNYTLSGADETKFEIDQKTGRIMTLMDLDFEAEAGTGENCADKNSCVVSVTATDSAGAVTATEATVTIKLKNVDEKPMFSSGYKMASVAEGTMEVDTDADDNADPASGESVYTAADPDRSLVTLSLMGNDGGMFRLNAAKVLTFKMAPDYEKPMDKNKDNVYEVTVRATDSTRMYADRMVRVTVTDDNEAPEIMGDSATIKYAENGEDAVAMFTATDPEGDTVTWAVDGDDAEDFAIIEDGVLTFAVGDDDTPPDFEDSKGGSSDDSNTYNVTVTASDDEDPPNIDMFAVTVMVTEVAEEGKVTWTVDPDGEGLLQVAEVNGGVPIMQFQVKATLTASVTDGDEAGADKDVEVTDGTWQWYRSSSKSSMGSPIEDATSSIYAVTTADEGKYLHVKASYNVGTGQEEYASLASDYKVLTARSSNGAPEVRLDLIRQGSE